MTRINVLPKNIADLIAAGEVVERPSSVIKEFLENSIDANSKNVTVEIQCGGKTYIRVTDNGCGIDKEDVRKAFLSHATSKISTKNDLDNISTLGFRGEALASVCSVAKVELLTRTAESDIGTRYVIEGGEEKLCDEAGCPVGTTLIVRDLFYNIPARMKFLKKDVQEGNYIAGVIERIAVSHPDVSVRFIRDGKLQFSTPGDGSLKSAVYASFGKEFTDGLLPVEYDFNGITVNGFTAKPTAGKSSRTMQMFFVNGRFVKSVVFMSALEAAYKNSILIGKFPPCVLFIGMPYSAVDVNVHPAKTEVRFYDEKRMFDAVYHAAFNTLNSDTVRPKANFNEAAVYAAPAQKGEQLKLSQMDIKPQESRVNLTESYKVSEYGTPVTGKENVLNSPSDKEEKQIDFLKDEYIKPKEKTLNISFNQAPKANIDIDYTESPQITATVDVLTISKPQLSEDFTAEQKGTTTLVKPIAEEASPEPDFRIIGEAFKTYIFVELDKKMLVIDKHAAHERILFEKFKSEAGKPTAQLMLQPVTVTLSADEYNAVLSNISLLESAGYEIDDFGDRCVKVNSCPAELVGEDIPGLVTEIAEYLSLNIKMLMPEKLDWIYHSMACRAAIKAGNTTTQFELEHFVKELLNRDDIKYCPHGRPVCVEVPKRDLEKMFKRIV